MFVEMVWPLTIGEMVWSLTISLMALVGWLCIGGVLLCFLWDIDDKPNFTDSEKAIPCLLMAWPILFPFLLVVILWKNYRLRRRKG